MVEAFYMLIVGPEVGRDRTGAIVGLSHDVAPIRCVFSRHVPEGALYFYCDAVGRDRWVS